MEKARQACSEDHNSYLFSDAAALLAHLSVERVDHIPERTSRLAGSVSLAR